LPLRRRWLRGRLRPTGSVEGGLLLVWLSWASRADQLHNPSQQRLNLRPQRGILGFHFGETLFCSAHVTRLHQHRKSAGTVPRY
jgi:hypothetical protein